MFSVSNVQKWLDEVVAACSNNGLEPEESIFSLVLFSSLDFEFVQFFRERKLQISRYSGSNVHLFTPMIFEGGVVPDSEWRTLRDDFSRSGVSLPNRPSIVLFRLEKRLHGTGYDPIIFAAYELPTFDLFERHLRDLVDICIVRRQDPSALAHELSYLFKALNRVTTTVKNAPVAGKEVLYAPRVFISYARPDNLFVRSLYNRLKKKGVRLWLDQFELHAGKLVRQEIEHALKACDVLILVLSSQSKLSSWVPFEGALFYSAEHRPARTMIPITLDRSGKSLAKKLPFLDGRLYVDFSTPMARRSGFPKLCRALQELKRG